MAKSIVNTSASGPASFWMTEHSGESCCAVEVTTVSTFTKPWPETGDCPFTITRNLPTRAFVTSGEWNEGWQNR